jgi:hypothetical protein
VAHAMLLLKHSFWGSEEKIRKGIKYYGSMSSVPASHLEGPGLRSWSSNQSLWQRYLMVFFSPPTTPPPQPHQENVGVVPQIEPQLLLSTSNPIPFLPVYNTACKSLTACHGYNCCVLCEMCTDAEGKVEHQAHNTTQHSSIRWQHSDRWD